MFQTFRIATNATDQTTEIIIRVTNTCSFPVSYAQFSLDSEDGKYAMSLQYPTAGSTWHGNGSFTWAVSVFDGRQVATKTTPSINWIRFTSSPSNRMSRGVHTVDFETFRFVVKNYDPVFPWYFQLHQGDSWDTFGPLDMSLCRCANCDASPNVRQISACTLRYPDASSSLSSSVFNEDEILYSYQIEGNQLELFYTDEHPVALGINLVLHNAQNTSFEVTPSPLTPMCVSGPSLKLGSWNFDGHDPLANIDRNGGSPTCVDAIGQPTCGRPIPPALFITDVTTDANNRSGDWQRGGVPYPPQKICGLWKALSKKVLSHNSATDTYSFDISTCTYANPPPNVNSLHNGWNLGAGADSLPYDFINPATNKPRILAFGAEVMWNLDLLNLDPSHKYRLQFTVHDADQSKYGGDAGEGCIITSGACAAGFGGASCLSCVADVPSVTPSAYTFYCYPTGGTGSDYYSLLKIPVSKLSDPMYNNSKGFIPTAGYKDVDGFTVGCDCQRKVLTCPSNCCGNGICNEQNGTCSCKAGTGVDPMNCCANSSLSQPCNNDNHFCSGHGTCSTPSNPSGVCECFSGIDGTPDFRGPACNISVEKKKKCADLNATDCLSCMALGRANALYCGWCTSGAPGSQSALSSGSCQEDFNCAAPKINLAACISIANSIPEPCADNCSFHGKCITKLINRNGSSSNSSLVCLCNSGYKGVNCVFGTEGSPPAGDNFGPIVLIALAIVFFVCLVAGLAYCVSTQVSPQPARPEGAALLA